MSHSLSSCPNPESMVVIACRDAMTLTEKLSEETENVSLEGYEGRKKCKEESEPSPNDEYFSTNRMIHYTDSVMASSKLFLILPALKAIADAEADGLEWTEFLKNSMDALPSFVLSFTLINMYWRTHSGLFRHITSCTSTIEVYNNFFLFFIASLPIASFAKGSVLPPFVFVVHTILVNITLLALHAAIRKELFESDAKNVPYTSFGVLFLSVSFIILSIALGFICVVPNPRVLSMLFLLPLMKPLTRYLDKKYELANRFAHWMDASCQRGRL